MAARKPSFHPKPETFRNLRREARNLKALGFNIVERRRIISEREKEHWLARTSREESKKWSKEYMEKRFRIENKVLKLLERLERAESTSKRIGIISRLGEMRYFNARVIKRLRAIAVDTSRQAEERLAAVRAIDYMAGFYSPKIFFTMAEKLPIEDIVLKKAVEIMPKKVTGSNIRFLRDMALRSAVLEKRVLGLRVLARMQSVFAITTLANLIRKIPPRSLERPVKITPRTRAGIQRLLSDRNLLEESTDSAKRLLKRLEEETKTIESTKYSLYANIYITGEKARAINIWLKNFGERYKIERSACEELIGRLESNRAQLVRIGGAEEARYAIENIDRAIETIREHIKRWR